MEHAPKPHARDREARVAERDGIQTHPGFHLISDRSLVGQPGKAGLGSGAI
jgi:hypothetical protein